MDLPLVSIIVVAYNQASFIRENLDSIKSQTYSNIELIVADDASSDNSIDVFESWLQENNFLAKKNFHTQNTGLATVLNECIAIAEGEYIKMIAADDFLHSEAIEKCVQRLESLGEEYGMVFTDTFMIDENSVITNDFNGYLIDDFRNQKLRYTSLLRENKIPALSTIIRKSVIIETGLYDRYFILEDYSRWLKIAELYKISFINEKLAYYRKHANNTSKLKLNKIKIEEMLLKSIHDKNGIYQVLINSHIIDYVTNNKLSKRDKSIFRQYKFLYPKTRLILFSKNLGNVYIKFRKAVSFLICLLQFYYYSLKVKTIFFFPFYHTGGAERVHLDIVKSLPRKKSIVIFTSNSSNSHFLKEFKEYAYCFDFKPFLKNKYYRQLLNYVFKFVGVFNKIVVFGCNSYYFYDVLKYFNHKVKRIDLLHAFTYPDNGGVEIYSLPYVELLDKRVVINQKTKDDYLLLYKNNHIPLSFVEKIVIINNAVPIPQKFKKVTPPEKLNVIYIGRISTEKRIDRVVKIAQNISTFANVSIYGQQGAQKQELDGFYKYNITDVNKLNSVYDASQILLITSYREGFPMVIMEAMARGVVCISTDVGGIPEHIKNGINGFLVHQGKEEEVIVQSFVDIISQLNSDRKLLETISQNARKYAKENFTVESFNQKYNEILEVS